MTETVKTAETTPEAAGTAGTDTHGATTGAAGTGELRTETGVASAGHEGKKVFPPLDATTFASQLIWFALAFGGLYLVMKRIALPRIGTVLSERKNRIEGDLEEAERLKAETEKALKSYEQALADAKAKANAHAQAMRDVLKTQVEAERASVDRTIAERIAVAEARIAAARTKALGDVGTIAADAAEAILGQLIGAKASRDEIAAAVAAVRRA